MRGVELRNITSQKSEYALYLRGIARAPIYDIRLEECSFANVEKPNVIEHVRDLRLDDVRINGRPA